MLGVALPVILAIWGFVVCECIEIQDSISDYYGIHPDYHGVQTRDIFVGTLVAIGVFLFAYRGHDQRDNIAGYVVCLLSLGVALFPNTGETWQQTIHFVSAVSLFLVLSYFCLGLFTEGNRPFDRQKIIRNRIYIACGGAILACIALTGTYFLFLEDTSISDIKPVFWLESIMLWTFGISWFIKGQTFWNDAPEPSV